MKSDESTSNCTHRASSRAGAGPALSEGCSEVGCEGAVQVSTGECWAGAGGSDGEDGGEG